MQQRCMFEPWKPSKTKSVTGGRQTTGSKLSSVLLILTRQRHLSHSANAISAENRKFCPPPSHSADSFGVTPFEFMEKLYGFWN